MQLLAIVVIIFEEWLPHDFEERIKENNKGMVVRALLHQQLMLKHMVIGRFLM